MADVETSDWTFADLYTLTNFHIWIFLFYNLTPLNDSDRNHDNCIFINVLVR